MARSLVILRGLRSGGRALSCNPWLGSNPSLWKQNYSSVPEQDLCGTAATEEKAKKVAGGGKQSIAEKLLAAVEKIHERRLPPELRRGVFGSSSAAHADPSRIEADIVNVAEQRIVRSMMNGDFENLPGKGRPLKFECNPHADPAEDMAYRILAKNGFAPEWVELNKDIRIMIQRWRASLAIAYQRKLKASGGQEDTEAISQAWKALLGEFEVELGEINRKVLKYNLLVPFGRQVMSYKLEKEIVLVQESEKSQRASQES
ncbi:unnamed protein product [Calypogeia fissa]